MRAIISAANDFPQFPQVPGGFLPAPAGNLPKAFFVHARVSFFQPRDVYFHPVPNKLTKVTTCCFWSQWYKLQIISIQKKLSYSLLAVQSAFQKHTAH